jgi:hypothetical protein
MADKKHEQSSFTVTDRRLFTSEGELRADAPEEVVSSKTVAEPEPVPAPQAATSAPEAAAIVDGATEMPPLPTAAEQQAQIDAYKKTSKEVDSQVELSGHSVKDFEMTFERFMASLYMTAMLQLGLMRQQAEQPRVDIIGARQTIDTLSLISDKTKNNLTPAEENFLHNSLYELRMAYVEVTNALARPPQSGPSVVSGTGTRGK